MCVRLEALNLDVDNPYNHNNDILVSFEYHEMNDDELRLTLDCYAGSNEERSSYRYHMKPVYTVDMYGVNYDGKDEMINKALHMVLPSLTDFILFLDSVIKRERH